MGYWKARVVPAFQKLVGKDARRKADAAEACKSFDDSKETINKEFEEKKTELEPKVIEIYEASSTEIKGLIKEPKLSGLKKHKDDVQKLLTDLVNIEFPGAKAVGEATTTYGVSYVYGPIAFIFEKVSSFIVIEEEKTNEVEVPAPAPATTETETTEREIVVEEDQAKEEAAAGEAAAAEIETPAAKAPEDEAKVQPTDQTAVTPKVDESPAAAEPPKP